VLAGSARSPVLGPTGPVKLGWVDDHPTIKADRLNQYQSKESRVITDLSIAVINAVRQ